MSVWYQFSVVIFETQMEKSIVEKDLIHTMEKSEQSVKWWR